MACSRHDQLSALCTPREIPFRAPSKNGSFRPSAFGTFPHLAARSPFCSYHAHGSTHPSHGSSAQVEYNHERRRNHPAPPLIEGCGRHVITHDCRGWARHVIGSVEASRAGHRQCEGAGCDSRDRVVPIHWTTTSRRLVPGSADPPTASYPCRWSSMVITQLTRLSLYPPTTSLFPSCSPISHVPPRIGRIIAPIATPAYSGLYTPYQPPPPFHY